MWKRWINPLPSWILYFSGKTWQLIHNTWCHYWIECRGRCLRFMYAFFQRESLLNSWGWFMITKGLRTRNLLHPAHLLDVKPKRQMQSDLLIITWFVTADLGLAPRYPMSLSVIIAHCRGNVCDFSSLFCIYSHFHITWHHFDWTNSCQELRAWSHRPQCWNPHGASCHIYRVMS